MPRLSGISAVRTVTKGTALTKSQGFKELELNFQVKIEGVRKEIAEAKYAMLKWLISVGITLSIGVAGILLRMFGVFGS